ADAAAAANPAAQLAAPAAQPPRIIQHIVVRGTQRVEPGTVLTYVGVREGDTYTPADVDTALKALTTTGLFSDVKTNFDDATDTLKGQIATEESRWWKFLASNDNYDPDRLQFDRESLRRYYINRGYADFKVLSAVANLTPDRSSFFLNFTVDEGVRYRFGNIT